MRGELWGLALVIVLAVAVLTPLGAAAKSGAELVITSPHDGRVKVSGGKDNAWFQVRGTLTGDPELSERAVVWDIPHSPDKEIKVDGQGQWSVRVTDGNFDLGKQATLYFRAKGASSDRSRETKLVVTPLLPADFSKPPSCKVGITDAFNPPKLLACTITSLASGLIALVPGDFGSGSASGGGPTQGVGGSTDWDFNNNFVTHTPLSLVWSAGLVQQGFTLAQTAGYAAMTALLMINGLLIVASPLVGARTAFRARDALGKNFFALVLVALSGFWVVTMIQLENVLVSAFEITNPLQSLLTNLALSPDFKSSIAMALAYLILAIFFVLIALRMLWRLAFLWLLVVLAPLAMACFAVPRMESYALRWSNRFHHTLFGQILLVVALWLGIKGVSMLSQPALLGEPKAAAGSLLIGIVMFFIAFISPKYLEGAEHTAGAMGSAVMGAAGLAAGAVLGPELGHKVGRDLASRNVRRGAAARDYAGHASSAAGGYAQRAGSMIGQRFGGRSQPEVGPQPGTGRGQHNSSERAAYGVIEPSVTDERSSSESKTAHTERNSPASKDSSTRETDSQRTTNSRMDGDGVQPAAQQSKVSQNPDRISMGINTNGSSETAKPSVSHTAEKVDDGRATRSVRGTGSRQQEVRSATASGPQAPLPGAPDQFDSSKGNGDGSSGSGTGTGGDSRYGERIHTRPAGEGGKSVSTEQTFSENKDTEREHTGAAAEGGNREPVSNTPRSNGRAVSPAPLGSEHTAEGFRPQDIGGRSSSDGSGGDVREQTNKRSPANGSDYGSRSREQQVAREQKFTQQRSVDKERRQSSSNTDESEHLERLRQASRNQRAEQEKMLRQQMGENNKRLRASEERSRRSEDNSSSEERS